MTHACGCEGPTWVEATAHILRQCGAAERRAGKESDCHCREEGPSAGPRAGPRHTQCCPLRAVTSWKSLLPSKLQFPAYLKLE